MSEKLKTKTVELPVDKDKVPPTFVPFTQGQSSVVQSLVEQRNRIDSQLATVIQVMIADDALEGNWSLNVERGGIERMKEG